MSLGRAWDSEPDLEKRDPNNLNEHLKISFDETIGESDHTHSLDCVWRYSHKCFNLWKSLCYVILATLFGVPIAMFWGCYFSCIAFWHIWEMTPKLRAIEINCHVCQRVWGLIVHSVCDPCCESMSKLFSSFKK